MKKLVILLFLLLPFASMAQSNPTDYLFNKYAGREGVESVNVPHMLIWFARWFVDDSDQDAKEILSQVNSVRVITIEDKDLNNRVDFYTELRASGAIDQLKKNYELLLETNDHGDRVHIFARMDKMNFIRELIIIVGGQENTLVSITGRMDLKKIADLDRSLHVGGMNELSRLDTAKVKKVN
ncbi:DUF4252 domain-containing protein [Prolixibacter sp. NT017]|uniref:DUF4252 domain-containing protein n=1 Tax=Prolixibacter sp. NT017 TaxID=2652390 RepID=UPI00126FA575|nr:DUF4252 domain-containing protein [Prolixibacter sp. NT017]GET26823.1 hypothetical protein NT017_31520 [Prolixibacter sp. NT017]